MAWTETYHCDVCGKTRTEESQDWWLGSKEMYTPTPGAAPQPVFRFTPWELFLSHSADAKHFCGARCAQTQLDRWMTEHHE